MEARTIEPAASSLEAVARLRLSAAEGSGVALRSADGDVTATLAAVAIAWLSRVPWDALRLIHPTLGQPRLLEEVVEAPRDEGLALRLFSGLAGTMTSRCPRARGGRCARGCREGCLGAVARIGASDEADAPQALLDYVRRGFDHGPRVRELWGDDTIARALTIDRSVVNEMERVRQFMRFSRDERGLWRGVMTPKADVLPLVASHFRGRMGGAGFSMVDPGHGTVVLSLGDQVEVHRVERDLARRISEVGGLAVEEPYVRALWKRFFERVSLAGRGPERRGYDLQTSLMAKRLRANLTELDPRVDDGWEVIPAIYDDRGRAAPSLDEGEPAGMLGEGDGPAPQRPRAPLPQPSQ